MINRLKECCETGSGIPLTGEGEWSPVPAHVPVSKLFNNALEYVHPDCVASVQDGVAERFMCNCGHVRNAYVH